MPGTTATTMNDSALVRPADPDVRTTAGRRGWSRPVLAAALASALILPPPAAADNPEPVSMGVCDMMVTATLDSAERLQGFLPPGYRIGRNLFSAGTRDVGVVMFWVFSCEGMEIPPEGRRVASLEHRTAADRDRGCSTARSASAATRAGCPRAVRFSFSTIAIETDERNTAATTTPRNFDLYAVHSHTDNPGLAAWLNASGFSMSVVERITIDRSGHVEYEIPHRDTGYEMTVHPLHPDVVGGVHNHKNTFWHEGADGRTAVFTLEIRNATDTACYLVVPCGEVRAAEGTRSADLLGGTQRPIHMDFDHVHLGEVTATVTSREP